MAAQIVVHLENDPPHYEPGDVMVAQVEWQLPAPPDYLQVALVWFTRGKGNTDHRVVERLRIDGPLESAGSKRLGIQLPVSPWSFSGRLISLLWAIEVTAYPSRTRTRCPFVMAPNREEIRLV
ncbi:MAG: hypothetical protein KatS3mg110_3419 [Pirellulaceae bacterium]|nr:MAG: hypothetical protein KatS3mg110_3419 [Pirellulaceae bacterium]